ncbi:MAG: S-layer homology domain-containing protein, partial [Slackia sp.]
ESTTRAMAATVLSRMVGLTGNDEASEPFSDVEPADWYFKEVAWAASTGIVSGYPGTDEFRPNGNVTRAEFCVMMQRYAAATGQGVALEAGEADEILAAYEDGASVEPWCKDAVAWAVKNEVFGGYSVLNPQGDITRAEMAKMAVAFQAEPLK